MQPTLSPDERWEQGIPHDPRSLALAKKLAEIDFRYGDLYCFKFGGDGDNGEDLLYLLDIYFETQPGPIGYTTEYAILNDDTLPLDPKPIWIDSVALYAVKEE